jgi:hypothetical protein
VAGAGIFTGLLRYVVVMRYGQGGGLDAVGRQRREAVRMRAVERLAAGDKAADSAADLRMGVRQVEKRRSVMRPAFSGQLLNG